MISLMRTAKDDPRFVSLVRLLDMDLAGRYDDGNALYQPLNTLEKITAVVLALESGEPVGCGAFKPYGEKAVEIKRVFVKPGFRGQGLSKAILKELEKWAAEEGFSRTVLETGDKQMEAISLYERTGYTRIPNYGPYAGLYASICFEKNLIAQG
jgi:GNAT superfamily N-acetyltransferase